MSVRDSVRASSNEERVISGIREKTDNSQAPGGEFCIIHPPKASVISDGDIPVKLWLLSRKERICSLVRDKSAVPEPDDLLRLACISNPPSQTAVNRACLFVRIPLPYGQARVSEIKYTMKNGFSQSMEAD